MKPYETAPVVQSLHGPLKTLAAEFGEYVAGVHAERIAHPRSTPEDPRWTNSHFVLDPTGQHVFSVVSRQYAAIEHLSTLQDEAFGTLHECPGNLLIGPKVFGRFYMDAPDPEALPRQGLIYLNSFDRQVSESLIIPQSLLTINLKHYRGNQRMDQTITELGRLMLDDYSRLLDLPYPLEQVAKEVLSESLAEEMFGIVLRNLVSLSDTPEEAELVKASDRPTLRIMARELRKIGFDDTLKSMVELVHLTVNHRMKAVAYKNSYHGHNKVLKSLVWGAEVVKKHVLYATF